MRKAYRIGEIEEAIGEMDLWEVPDDIMESDEDYMITISGWWVHIPRLGINLHEGIFCNYDEDEKEYLPDFCVTIITDAGEIMEGGWIYYEQDGFAVTLANYLHGKMDMGQIEQMECFLCLPEGGA